MPFHGENAPAGDTDLAFGAVSCTGRAKKLRNTSLEAEESPSSESGQTRVRRENKARSQSSKGNRACEKTSNASVITLVLNRTPELRHKGSREKRKVSVGIFVFFEALRERALTSRARRGSCRSAIGPRLARSGRERRSSSGHGMGTSWRRGSR